jgi:quaternary ammonium compound-resistance protein SugE
MTIATPSPTRPTSKNKTTAWFALLLAGAFEVGYALSVNGSRGFTSPGWSVTAVVFFLLTLFFLSVALKGIDVGSATRSGQASAPSAPLSSARSSSTRPSPRQGLLARRHHRRRRVAQAR